MIGRKFDPRAVVLDAARRNHPADLSRALLRILRHMTGEREHITEETLDRLACKYLDGDKLARTEKLELSILTAVTIVVEANGELVLVDDTDGARFAPLWFALTGLPTMAHGEAYFPFVDFRGSGAKVVAP